MICARMRLRSNEKGKCTWVNVATFHEVESVRSNLEGNISRRKLVIWKNVIIRSIPAFSFTVWEFFFQWLVACSMLKIRHPNLNAQVICFPTQFGNYYVSEKCYRSVSNRLNKQPDSISINYDIKMLMCILCANSSVQQKCWWFWAIILHSKFWFSIHSETTQRDENSRIISITNRFQLIGQIAQVLNYFEIVLFFEINEWNRIYEATMFGFYLN